MDIVECGRKAAKSVEDLIDAYSRLANQEVPDKPRWQGVNVPTKTQLNNALKSHIYNSTSQAKTIKRHWEAMKALHSVYINEAPFSSSPFGFRTAYKDLVGKEIANSEAIELGKKGLNLLPVDPAARISPVHKGVHPVFRASQQGIILYTHKVKTGPLKGTTKVVRAGIATGGYDDAISPEYILYDTSTKMSSYLRARHIEQLSEEIFQRDGQGLILQIAGHIDIRGGLDGREYKSFYIMGLCEVVPPSKWDPTLKQQELDYYKDELFLPYLLKPLDATFACKKLRAINLLDNTTGNTYQARTPLTDKLAKKYNYNFLKTQKQKKQIYDYITSENPKCSHAISTGGKITQCSTALQPNGTTHIGHIFSQNWCSAYSVFQESVNHPDNLYLSCNTCNTTLNQGCPDKNTLKLINKEGLTIGDLIRAGHLN
ncbi:MAG: hypothetical protein ACPH9K_06770 [Candidatus Poseidoniaceae archaeon]